MDRTPLITDGEQLGHQRGLDTRQRSEENRSFLAAQAAHPGNAD